MGAPVWFAVLSAGSSVAKGVAGMQAGQAEASRLKGEAMLADTQALERDTAARDELSRYLSTVSTARAANGLSATSPNAMLLMSEATQVSDSERMRMTADDKQRAANFRTAAGAAQRQGFYSLITGVVGAGIPLAQYKMNQ